MPLINFKTSLTFLLLFTLLPWAASGQQYDCARALLQYQVVQEGGVNFQATWKKDAEVIARLDKGTEIRVCGNGTSPNNTVKAFYQDKTGYVDKSAIKVQEQINVTILKIMMGENFPVADQYFGIFDPKMKNGNLQTPVEECYTKADSLQLNDGSHHMLNVLDQQDRPKILISGLKLNPEMENRGKYLDGKLIYPGESVYWRYEENEYILYAKGEMVEEKAPDSFAPFSNIKNYELHVRRSLNGLVEDQVLFKMDLPAWNAHQFEGGVHIYWMGDLDGDRKMDLILTVAEHYACWEQALFLSSQAEPGYFFKEVVKVPACGS